MKAQAGIQGYNPVRCLILLSGSPGRRVPLDAHSSRLFTGLGVHFIMIKFSRATTLKVQTARALSCSTTGLKL